MTTHTVPQQHIWRDALMAVLKIAAVPVAFVAAYLALQWGAEQQWIGIAVQWIIGIPVALFVLYAVIIGVLSR